MLIAFTTITVPAQNKLLSSIDEYYDTYSSTWQKSYGTNYEYDSNNNLSIETEVNWNSNTGFWESGNKTTYSYNASDKITQAVYQNRNQVTNQLENSFRDVYTYTNGRLTGIEEQNWTGSNWENDYKFAITYNSNNLPDTTVSYIWNGSQWNNDERSTYTYDTNNKVSTEVWQEWINAQWLNSFKSLYTYNANNQLISNKGANWDEFNSIWVEAGAQRTDYAWDATGNRSSRTDSGNYDYKEEYTYDSGSLMSSFVHPFKDKTGVDYFFEGFPYVNKVLIITGFSYNSGTNSYTNSYRTTYNYDSSITLGIETQTIADERISVYPNPTSDYLNIQNDSNTTIDTITVTDLTGRKVLDQNQNTMQINVQNLAKGMYVLEVSVGEHKEIRKFLKD